MSEGRRQHEEHSILRKVDVEGPQRINCEAYINQTNPMHPDSLLFQASLGRRTQRWFVRYFTSFFFYYHFAFFLISYSYLCIWFLFFSFLFFLFVSINCFVVESEEICVALDEFGCSFDYQFAMNHSWSYCGIPQPLFPPHSLSLPSFPDSFRSPFAPPFLPFRLLTVIVERWYAATAVRSGMNTRDYSLFSQVLFSIHFTFLHPPPYLTSSLLTTHHIGRHTDDNDQQQGPMNAEREDWNRDRRRRRNECPHVGSVSYNKDTSSLSWYLFLYCFVVFCFLFYYPLFASLHFLYFFLECK